MAAIRSNRTLTSDHVRYDMQRGIQTGYLDPRSVASDLLESDTPRSAVSWRERKVQTIGHQTRNRRASEQGADVYI